MNHQIKLFESDLIIAKIIANKRSGSMGHSDTINSQTLTLPSFERHFVGAKGEVGWHKLSGDPIDIKTIGRGDKGIDFPGGKQVKASERDKKPNLLFPILDYDQYERKKHHVKWFILAWIKNHYICEIMGRITKSKVDQLKVFWPKGFNNMKTDSWCVSHKQLEPIPTEWIRRAKND